MAKPTSGGGRQAAVDQAEEVGVREHDRAAAVAPGTVVCVDDSDAQADDRETERVGVVAGRRLTGSLADRVGARRDRTGSELVSSGISAGARPS